MAIAENKIVRSDSLMFLRACPSSSANLVYIDPPFNTGKTQTRTRIRTVQDANGDRIGFAGKRYRTIELGTTRYLDAFDDYLTFLEPHLHEIRRVLATNGSFFLHVDYREVHYCKVLLDSIFGRNCFQNEIVWAYDYGGRSKRKWPAKHDNILWHTKDPKNYTFNLNASDRIPYLAPSLVGAEKAERGKTPTDVWWNTIVPTNGSEKTGYATQKPLSILERIVLVHSNVGDVCLDCFAGSGTLGEAAAKYGRRFLLADNNRDAVFIMRNRLRKYLRKNQ